MAARGETRQRILETAQHLFHQQGYHSTGLNQILAEGDAPKGSLYFHFPGGKEQLAAEAVTLAAADVSAEMDTIGSAASDRRSAVRAVVDALGSVLEQSGFRAGCPIATVALEAASDSAPVRKACRRGYQSWMDLIARRLHQAGVPEYEAAELAVFTVSAVEGALLLARVQQDLAPLRIVGARVAAVIEDAITSQR